MTTEQYWLKSVIGLVAANEGDKNTIDTPKEQEIVNSIIDLCRDEKQLDYVKKALSGAKVGYDETYTSLNIGKDKNGKTNFLAMKANDMSFYINERDYIVEFPESFNNGNYMFGKRGGAVLFEVPKKDFKSKCDKIENLEDMKSLLKQCKKENLKEELHKLCEFMGWIPKEKELIDSFDITM